MQIVQLCCGPQKAIKIYFNGLLCSFFLLLLLFVTVTDVVDVALQQFCLLIAKNWIIINLYKYYNIFSILFLYETFLIHFFLDVKHGKMSIILTMVKKNKNYYNDWQQKQKIYIILIYKSTGILLFLELQHEKHKEFNNMALIDGRVCIKMCVSMINNVWTTDYYYNNFCILCTDYG